MNDSKNLVQITYYREGDKNNIKKAIVTEQQASDIKAMLSHIYIVSVSPAPSNSVRSYILE